MTRNKKLAVAAAGVLALGWLYATPYLAVRAMKEAALAGDAQGINERVDFPALKENLKATFSAKLMSEAGKDSDDPMAGAGAALGMMVIGPIVDGLVTPEAISMMMKGKAPMANAANTEQAGSGKSATDTEIDADMAYRNLDTFAVTLRNKGEAGEPMTMLFKRHGLTNWKLTAVELPL
jgi:hypothetical protein